MPALGLPVVVLADADLSLAPCSSRRVIRRRQLISGDKKKKKKTTRCGFTILLLGNIQAESRKFLGHFKRRRTRFRPVVLAGSRLQCSPPVSSLSRSVSRPPKSTFGLSSISCYGKPVERIGEIASSQSARRRAANSLLCGKRSIGQAHTQPVKSRRL